MAHFAELDENNIIIRVCVINDSFITNEHGIEDEQLGIKHFTNQCGGRWVQCSYHTWGGTNSRGKPAFRKNYPGAGFSYDPVRDAFIPPKPHPSWILDEETCRWETPIPFPTKLDHDWTWDETQLKWIPFYPE
jgi:hypothetical protein